jgi:hypothetical protein
MGTQQKDDGKGIGSTGRGFSFLGGAAFLFYAMKKGTFSGILAAFAGAELLYRGLTGKDPLFQKSAGVKHPDEDVITGAEDFIVREAPFPKAGGWLLKPAGTNKRRASARKIDFRKMSKAELYRRARELDIVGRSRMNRQQLIRALS